MLRDKDDVGLRQIGEECSLADLTRIDHTAVEPRSTGNCPLVAALYLHIVNGLAIGRKCVESYGTSIEIWHTLLGNDLRHAQSTTSMQGIFPSKQLLKNVSSINRSCLIFSRYWCFFCSISMRITSDQMIYLYFIGILSFLQDCHFSCAPNGSL